MLDRCNNQLTQIPHIEGLEKLDCRNNQLTQDPCIKGCEIYKINHDEDEEDLLCDRYAFI